MNQVGKLDLKHEKKEYYNDSSLRSGIRAYTVVFDKNWQRKYSMTKHIEGIKSICPYAPNINEDKVIWQSMMDMLGLTNNSNNLQNQPYFHMGKKEVKFWINSTLFMNKWALLKNHNDS